MIFTLITALLWTCSLISVSVSEFHTVEVQPGEQVTLMCSNFTSFISHIFWFRLTSRANISCISSMLTSDTKASLRDGFQSGKFNMTSNTSTLFLTIQPVDVSDSGLYFCGLNADGNSVVVSATYLNVQEVSAEITSLTSVILGALLIFLIAVIIGLVVKIRKLHPAHTEGQNLHHSENLGSDDLNYAALSFHQRAKSSRRPPSENQLEPHVVYAATR
ncbi:uncharacterized protein LOC125884354 [Epinephelus fuscoguttatus]|uniref:uncharacterized protein LOC125884354 n=1 Tax=Epinephelus fuscoguttatus TaxID=293821 RepID=UPI0020D17521|nr:uncharacterized protein LOC125884354 [Epinephelus fuscoguttatus]